MNHSPRERGFTLIELIIYMGIVSIMLLVFTSFLVDVTASAGKGKVSREVQQNARLLMARMVQDIRNAEDVDVVSADTLDLDGGEAVLDGKTFTRQVPEDQLLLNSEPLSNEKVRVTDLAFSENTDGTLITIAITVEQGTVNAPPAGQDTFQLTSVAAPRTLLY